MRAYNLPTSLTIGEVVHPINYGWQTAIEIFCEMNDPEKSRAEQVAVMLVKLFPNWKEFSSEQTPEAIQKACDFLDCGKKPDGKVHPRLVDWEQDAEIIIPAVNQAANQEIRLNPNIHWWTFFGWYMSIDGGIFSSVLHIRQKKAKGKRLEKWEEEFYRDNKHLVDIKIPESAEVRNEVEDIMKKLF